MEPFGINGAFWCQRRILVSTEPFAINLAYWCQQSLLLLTEPFAINRAFWYEFSLLESTEHFAINRAFWYQRSLLLSTQPFGINGVSCYQQRPTSNCTQCAALLRIRPWLVRSNITHKNLSMFCWIAVSAGTKVKFITLQNASIHSLQHYCNPNSSTN